MRKNLTVLLSLFLFTSFLFSSMPFISDYFHEKVVIVCFEKEVVGNRKGIIDFEIELKAKVPDVSIAGSKDTIKGYGGFSVRINLADSTLFRGQSGTLEPINGQMQAGPWVDFHKPDLNSTDNYGLTIFCDPTIPNFPSPWLLRKKSSMQNPAFPGWEKYIIPSNKSLKLQYRLIVYDGYSTIEMIDEWYNNFKTKK